MKIGFTSTIPVEIILAGGAIPVDLNNLFINSPQSGEFIRKAEEDGFPRNVCAWIKGLYSVALYESNIDMIVAVLEGDCSNTRVLMELFQDSSIATIPFAYPTDHQLAAVRRTIRCFADRMGVSFRQIHAVKRQLDDIRRRIIELDRLTYENNTVSGLENHLFQVNCSDFIGNPDLFAAQVDHFLEEVRHRDPFPQSVRLAYLGVPPIISGLYQACEFFGARVVFNEIQRQFSMPYLTRDIFLQYYHYTYPYPFFWRIKDIRLELEKRRIDGVIHYVQSFCHRHIEDILIRRYINQPVLTIEGEAPGELDERTRIRLQSFIEMLKDQTS